MSIGTRHLKTGLYSNSNGYSCAIVAVITEGIDWAAYMGGCSGDVSDTTTIEWVAQHGDKIPKKLAQFIFPDIELSYRQ
jgi:hypothetical protein